MIITIAFNFFLRLVLSDSDSEDEVTFSDFFGNKSNPKPPRDPGTSHSTSF